MGKSKLKCTSPKALFSKIQAGRPASTYVGAWKVASDSELGSSVRWELWFPPSLTIGLAIIAEKVMIKSKIQIPKQQKFTACSYVP